MAHAPGWVPRFWADRRRAHRVRVRHQREQGREPRPRCVFRVYALVGEAESLVRSPRSARCLYFFLVLAADGVGAALLGHGSSYWECLV